MHNNPQHIVFYDGTCGLCNKAVQTILKYDQSKSIHFCSLQSELGQQTLTLLKLPTSTLSTFIYKKENDYYTKSSAALHTFKDCNSWISLLYIFIIIPKTIRDFIYDIIAKNRHKLITTVICKLPGEDEKKRFI